MKASPLFNHHPFLSCRKMIITCGMYSYSVVDWKEWERRRKRKQRGGGGGGENWQTPSCQFCFLEGGAGLTSSESKAAKLYANNWGQMTVFLLPFVFSVGTEACAEIISCASQDYNGSGDGNELKNVGDYKQSSRTWPSSGGRFCLFEDNDKTLLMFPVISSLRELELHLRNLGHWLELYFIRPILIRLERALGWSRFVSFLGSIC